MLKFELRKSIEQQKILNMFIYYWHPYTGNCQNNEKNKFNILTNLLYEKRKTIYSSTES